MGRNSKILDLMGQRQKHKEENKTTQSQTSNKFWCIRFGCLDCEMVYISSNGQVQDSHGWSLQNVKRTFWNFIDGVLLFFQTLVMPNSSRRGDRYVTSIGAPRSGLYNNSRTERRIGRPATSCGVSAPPAMGGG